MKKIYKYFILIFPLVVLSGCANFFDINKDKNNPLDATLPQLMLAPELSVFDAFGDGAGGLGDLTGQWAHHTVQRGPNNFYFMDGNEFNIQLSWGTVYNQALEDLNIIIDKGTTQGGYTYAGVAKLLKAYTLATTIDIYGIAVDTEFGQGAANLAPHFDTGEQVYAHCFALIDDAKADLAKTVVSSLAIPKAANSVDQIYKGDIDKWTRFANSLKLKLYNQVRLTSMYNAADVAALITANNFMGATTDGFRFLYTNSNTPENRHPLFSQDYQGGVSNYIDPSFFCFMKGISSTTSDAGGSTTATVSLNPLFSGIVDPRIPYYFYNQLSATKNPQNPFSYRNGNFLGIWFASFNIDPKEGFDQSSSSTLVGLYPCGGPYDDGSGTTHTSTSGLGGAGYQRLYPYYSHLFTRAELALTMGTEAAPAAADSLLSKGITAAFAEVNEMAAKASAPLISNSALNKYRKAVIQKFAGAATPDAKLEVLMSAKWVANFKSGPDAYTDYRRTGYPVMFDPGTDNNPLTVLNRNYPVSFPLNSIELKTNANAPTDRNPGLTKVFWDVN
jgi:hypothetical protein